MPDFFGEGNAFNIENYPPKNDSNKNELQGFLAGTANPPATAARLVNFAKVLKGEGFEKLGAHGYCWGKITMRYFEVELLNIFFACFQVERLSHWVH